MFNSKFSIGVLKHPGYNIDFGDGGTPAPQQNTTVTTNIPEYAQPYVENMLGATQRQLFNMDASGNISGIKPYTPYSTNMNDYIAGFSPLQKQAQTSAANLTTPGQFNQATQYANAAGLGSLGTATTAAGAGNQYFQMAQDPNAIKNFMNPYLQQSLNPQLDEIRRQYGITGTQEKSAATGAGAFGGSREALMAAENTRNMNAQMNQAIGNAYNNAFQQAQQAQQYGAGLGLQGQQAALQGYGQAGQAASTLGSLGAQNLAAQQGIIGTQNQIGAQQTAAEQAKINQAIQDYATAQQYPLMELGVMSNMTRGLPLSAPTTAMYQAQPSAGTQLLGAAGALGSLANAIPKTAAQGGIMSYDIGGAVEYDLSRMPTDKLNELKATAQSKIEKEKINKILAERKLDDTPQFAPGGIVAFGTGGELWDKFKRGVSDLAGTKEAAAADANAEPDKVTPFLGKAARFLAGNEDAAASTPTPTAYNPGINATDSGIKLGPDVNTYLPPDINVEVPTVGEPPKEIAAIKPSEIDKILAKYATPRSEPNAAAVNYNQVQGPSDSLDAKLESVISSRKNIDQALADGLNNIYQDPVVAPYAKRRFNQFQDQIDGASEKERQMFWLHSATMFATMATQPGGVIKAAMGALAQEIPLYVKDKDALEKHMEELNKAQYDITQSEIARRVGDLKTSLDLKDKALKETADIYIAINKDKMEKAKLEEDKVYHRGMVDVSRLHAAAAIASANRPGEKERLIDRALNDTAFATELMNQTLGPKELQDASKLRSDYDKWIAQGNEGTIEEYAASHKVGAGGNAFPGFKEIK